MSLNIFNALKPLHIPGRKEETSHDDVITIPDHFVSSIYIPLVNPNGQDITLSAQVGDVIKKGQKIGTRTDFYVPIYSSISGTIVNKEMLYHPIIGRVVPHFVIENDFKYTTVAPLPKHGMDATKEEIIQAIKEGGLTGLGGSGFPTFIKYETKQPIHTILINAVECEPFLSTDYKVSQLYARDVLQGAELLRKAVDATSVIIAFKNTKLAIKEALLPLLPEFPTISLKIVPDVYPMGWERTLIRTLLKKEYDKLPSEIGVIVSNLTSAIATSDLVLKGMPVMTRILTISGAGVKKPANIEVPVGVLMSQVVAACDGYTQDEVTAFIGGPMSAKAVLDDQFAVQQHFGGFTVLSPVASQEEACLRCGACTSNCPANLQPIEIKLALDSQNTARLMKLDAMKCVECGICTYVCPSKIEVTEAVRKGKAKTRIELLKQKHN